jgi:glycosyltransferase involved in cell wall biosynthesis
MELFASDQTMGHPEKQPCVVLVVDDLGFGGAERQVVELANRMDPTVFDVHVCALSEHVPLSDMLIDARRRLHIIPKRSSLDFTLIPRLAHLLRALHADIVHGYLFRAEIASRLAGCIARTKLVIGSERNANRVLGKRYILAYKWTRWCADLIIANSYAGAESNARVFGRPPSDYRIVHNGVDAERFYPSDPRPIREELAIPAQDSVVGVFANFKKQKNHALLFRAFRLVLDSFPQARLLIVGEQPMDRRGTPDDYRGQLDHLLDVLGIRRQCTFLGHRKDVERLYPACDITVLPSLHEGTPNVLLESMACGVPVVATSVCDNPYIVRDGEVGYLVAVGDEGQMANRITQLLGNPALRQEMGRKARTWVLREFSSKRLAEKMGATYLELLGKQHA